MSWYLSCDGDTAHLGQKYADAPPGVETFTRIAQNAERSGFSTILIPTHQSSAHFYREAPAWDSLVNAAVVAPATKSIKLLLAVRAGVIEPAVAARILASLDELSGGRILYNVVTGGKFQTAFSGEIDHDDRYERTEEYLQILEGLWTQDRYSFEGKYYKIEDATVYPKPVQKPRIPFFLAGSSEIAKQIAVRRAEYSVFWGQNPEQVSERVREMEKRLEGTGRRLKYVTRFQIIARESEDEAFEAAQELLSQADPDVLAQRGIDPSLALGNGHKDPRERTREELVGPNLWGGMERIRSGSTVAIVGSYEQCARKIIEIEQAGIDLLILSGFPLYSECERIGRHVIPLVREMERELGLADESGEGLGPEKRSG
ncbi:LLM class flavin-dependent oxidoreductase [Nitrospinota bacterium]